ncbi:uncharacterized protein BJX67DRAFT_66662 [Aspergillus lucknowensis]|uniref:Uncharacterized protein n=1 Tax=Aspergillus lucknowensis TaxID=176173 RepID=A0ABR4LUN0_9EURO
MTRDSLSSLSCGGVFAFASVARGRTQRPLQATGEDINKRIKNCLCSCSCSSPRMQTCRQGAVHPGVCLHRYCGMGCHGRDSKCSEFVRKGRGRGDNDFELNIRISLVSFPLWAPCYVQFSS